METMKNTLKWIITSLIALAGVPAWADIAAIQSGQVVQAVLENTDATLNGQHYDEYSFTGEQGRAYRITATSGGFSPSVVVLDTLSGEKVPVQEEPSESMLFSGVFSNKTGDYTFLVSGEKPGAYFLSVEPVGETEAGSNEFWVRIEFLGEALWTIIGLPSYHMTIKDNHGANWSIAPRGCITLSGGPKRYTYSAWILNNFSKTKPPQEKVCDHTGHDAYGNRRCIPRWYHVKLPAGSQPAQYWAACELHWRPWPFN